MRFIDGHIVMERLQGQTEVIANREMVAGLLMAQGTVLETPTIDAVEVVRCKDCIRTMERDNYTGRLWCSMHRDYMEDTYYCADGLRREDGEE